MPQRGEIVRGRRHVQRDGAHPLVEAVAHDILRGDVRQLRIDFHQRHVDLGTAHAQAQAPQRRRPRRTRPPGRPAARRSPPPAGWRRGRRGGRASSASAATGRRAPRRRCVSGFGPLDARPQLMRQPGVLQQLRAASQYSSSTTMRRGSMPSEPSSTLMCWSSTMCGMSAPLSSASIAVISTALLVRTSSCKRRQLRRRSSAGARCAR